MTNSEKKDEKMRAEEKYKALVETAADAIFTLDLLGRFTFVNPAAERISGYSEEELVGKHFRELLPAKYIPACLNVFQKALRGQPTPPIEIEMITKQGERVSLELLGRPVKRGKRVVEIIGIARDITERKQAEEALRESEEKYRNLVERANDGITIIQDTIIRYANPRLAEMWGGTVQEFIGTQFTDYVHPDELPKVVDRYKRRMAGEDVTPIYETVLRRKDTSKLYAELNAGVITYQGKPANLVIVRDITERKWAEEALRETRDYLENLIGYANAPIIVWDPEFRITRFNHAFEHLTGYTADEVIGQELPMLFPQASREESLSKISRTLSGEYWKSEEIPILRKDGDTRLALWNSANIYAEDGTTILATIAQGTDITQRKRTEEALRETEENFRAVAENANEGILVSMGEGVHVYVNKRAAQITGYSVAELLETDMKGLVHPDEFEKVMERYRKRLAGKPVPTRYETIFIHKDGRSVPVEFTAAKTIWQGKPASVVFFRDITKRKQAEEALARERSLLHALMDNIPDYIYFKDRESRFIRTTKAHAKTFGLSDPTEAIGKTDFDFFSDEHARQAYKDEQEIIRTGEPLLNVEERETWPDRPDTWVLTSKMPLRNAEGNIIGTFGISRDITERKRAEEAYRTVVDYSLQGLVIVQDFQLAFANQAFAEISGYTIEELLFLSPEEVKGLVHPEDQALVWGRFQDRMAGKPLPPRYQYRGIRKDGTMRWLEMYARRIDYRGKPAVQAAIVDITERKRAEEALRESEERYRTLIERANDGIAIIQDTIIRYANPRLAEIWGGTMEKLIGTPFTDHVDPDELPKVVDRYKRRMAGEEVPPIYETVLRRKGGSKVYVELNAGAITYQEKAADLVIVRDITERKRAEEEIRRRSEELAALNAIVMAVTSTLDLQEVLDTIQSKVMELLDEIYPPYFFLFNEEDRALQMTVTHLQEQGLRRVESLLGMELEEHPFPLSTLNPALREALLSGTPYLSDDLSDLLELEISRKLINDLQRELEIKWVVVLPLWVKGKLVGIMLLVSPKETMPEEEIELLSAIASQAAIAIENARLYEETQKRLAETTVLHKVAEIINATLDLKEVFQRVVEELSTTFGYRLVDIYLLEEDGLRLQANIGYDDKTTIELVPLERGVVGRVARTGQPAFIPDVSQDPDYIPAYPEIKSEICIPVKSGETLLGTLNVESDAKRPLTDDDLKLLVTLSSHIGVAIDNARLYEETQQLAITDGLTGLHNLRYFYEALEKEIQRSERYHRSVSLIILDIDDFKAYNDLYGHLAGDDLLKELAQLMSKVTRRTDTLARYGGEEFAIILPETETEGGGLLSERLLEEVRGHRFSTQDGQTMGRITISLGIATYPHHADSAKALVNAADKALLRAKRAGKNRLSVYEEN